MSTKAINLNEKMPPEEETDISTKTLGSVDSTSLPFDKQNTNGSGQKPPSSADNSTVDVPAKVGEATKPSTVVPRVANDVGPDNDIQKKIRRAERFGVQVQLSEAEKRSSRAERFGTTAGMKKPDVLSQSEELKRKARGERFGTSTPPANTDDEVAKKKARLARFSSGSAKISSEEEDKRKARAARFSNPLSNPLSEVSGKEAVVGRTIGQS
ncbi:hypothetical protein SAY86_030078 [Trapa natans]|uniref:THO1-MOS11 C-terminal domain-containing protein n=1 Tax=Trapa natans TaxID=22666 RepID=A0AAN7MFG8_TRANT|nr:hypothetical protein SAY86_030078 [Trapa natans]